MKISFKSFRAILVSLLIISFFSNTVAFGWMSENSDSDTIVSEITISDITISYGEKSEETSSGDLFEQIDRNEFEQLDRNESEITFSIEGKILPGENYLEDAISDLDEYVEENILDEEIVPGENYLY